MEWLVCALVVVLFIGLFYIGTLARQMKRMAKEAEQVRKLHYETMNQPRSERKLKD